MRENRSMYGLIRQLDKGFHGIDRADAQMLLIQGFNHVRGGPGCRHSLHPGGAPTSLCSVCVCFDTKDILRIHQRPESGIHLGREATRDCPGSAQFCSVSFYGNDEPNKMEQGQPVFFDCSHAR